MCVCVCTRVCVCEIPGRVGLDTLYTQSVLTSTVNCVCVCVCVCVCASTCVRAYECTVQ